MESHFTQKRVLAIATTAFLGLLSVFFISSSAYAAVTGSILPTGDGYSLQWTTSTGTAHYTLVDETTCNGLTDYVQTTTVGQRDAFTTSLSSVPDGSTITSIAIKPCASRVSGGGANPVMNLFHRFDGVNSADSGAYSLTGTTPAELATTTFAGLSKVKGSTTTLQVGAVLTSSTKGARLSRLSTVITYTPLAAPTALVATASSSSSTVISLAWTDNATNETGYLIERGLSSTTLSQIGSSATSTYTDKTAAPGTTYYYKVRATNTGGNSAYSNIASATTGSVPSAPTTLSTASISSSQIDLSWTDTASNETGYSIERSLTSGSGFSLVATRTANTVAYSDTGLSNGTTYFYRVKATNGYGSSAYSNESSTTTAPAPLTAPSGLTGTQDASLIQINLSWTDNSTDETAFAVERKLSTSGSYTHLATTSANATTYNDNTVTGGATYNYRVRGYKTAMYGSYSNIATATAPNVPGTPFLSTSISTSTPGGINLSYFGSNTSFYTIERSFTSTTSFSFLSTSSSLFYVDVPPSNGTWWYRVFGTNNYGSSGYSNADTETLP